jgi:hypothetical protein
MSLSVDLKYTLLLSPRFEKFQRKSDYLFNVRCPICGDSRKNKSKMRGYIYRKGNDLFYKCHNCGAGMSVGNLIKQVDDSIYKSYVLERYKSGEINGANTRAQVFNVPSPRFGKIDAPTFDNAERCDSLADKHFCKIYLTRRHIPTEYHNKLYFTANFKKFCDEVYPNHDKEITPDARLVIPFFDEYNNLIAVSGRALVTSDEKLRYVTIRTNESEDKLIYGMDRVDLSEPVKIVEGPIDSLFLKNCVASGDSSLSIAGKNINSNKKILIFDNEPRNKEIVSLMEKAIKSMNYVVVWPDNIRQKDINEMIMSGISTDEIEAIISNNTFYGLEAITKFVFWKKI